MTTLPDPSDTRYGYYPLWSAQHPSPGSSARS
jgi:hypothetical protein